MEYYASFGLTSYVADGLVIERNEISNTSYSAMSLGWGHEYYPTSTSTRKYTVRFNKIHDFTRDDRDLDRRPEENGLFKAAARTSQKRKSGTCLTPRRDGSTVCRRSTLVQFTGSHRSNPGLTQYQDNKPGASRFLAQGGS